MLTYKIEKRYEKSTVFWNEYFKYCLELSIEQLAAFSREISFPEVSFGFVKFLRKLSNEFKFIVYRMMIKEVLKIINENSEIILKKRKDIKFNPSNVKQCLEFIGI